MWTHGYMRADEQCNEAIRALFLEALLLLVIIRTFLSSWNSHDITVFTA